MTYQHYTEPLSVPYVLLIIPTNLLYPNFSTMKIKHLIAGLLIMITASVNAQCFVPTFADEFDSTSLDLTKWNYQPGDGCPVNCGWGNNELEYYTTSTNNVSVANGELTITARYEPNYNGTGKNYTSGKLVTLGKFSQTHGKIEARIKMPSAQGVWPAFWMLADNTNWPSTGEIDIIECKGLNPTTGYSTLHYGSKANGSHLQSGTTWTYPATLSAGFHVYAIEWDATTVRWYLDGVLKYTVTKTQATKKGTWPFSSQNFYIILNVAVGGNFAGSVNSAQYPVSMVVDYVH